MPEFNDWFPGSLYNADDAVNVKAFGAIGDGYLNAMGTLYPTGSDAERLALAQVDYPNATALTDSADWCAIQGALDYAMQNNIIRVYMPKGRYLTTDTLHLGYGKRGGVGHFECIQLEGAGWAGLSGQPIGVVILPQFVDRPVINIQSGRQSGVRRIWIVGMVEPTNPYAQPVNFRANPANYKPTGAQDFPKAPFCGICIDAYFPGGGTDSSEGANVVPSGGGYVAPKFPSWVQSTTNPYNKGSSSDVFVEDCSIYSTMIGIMLHPYGDAQGEFVKCTRTTFSLLYIAFACGNSQGRNVDLSNCCIFSTHTAFDGSTYGNNIGNMQGSYDNISMVAVYQVFNVIYAPGFPTVVHSMYGELCGRVGTFVGHISFDSCHLACSDADYIQQSVTISSITQTGGTATVTCSSLAAAGWTWGTGDFTISGATPSGYNVTNGVGTWVDDTHFTYAVAGGTASPATVVGTLTIPKVSEWLQEPFFIGTRAQFRNCSFWERNLYHFDGVVELINCDMGGPARGAHSAGGLLTQGHRKALTAFSRVVISNSAIDRTDKGPFSGHRWVVLGRDKDYQESIITTNGYNTPFGFNLWNFGQADDYYSFEYDVYPMVRNTIMGVSDNGTLSGITRTLTVDPVIAAKAEIGDVIYMQNKAWYCVNSISGNDLTCQQITHFKMISGVYTSLETGVGNQYYYPIGVLDFVPAGYYGGSSAVDGLFFETTAPSNVIELVKGDGTAITTMPPEISLTSKPLWIGGDTRFWANSLPFPANTFISSIDTTAKTLTMSANANVTGTYAYGPGIKKLK